MDGGSSEGSEAQFAAYVEALGVVLGRVDRQQPMHDCCLGLLMPIERNASDRWWRRRRPKSPRSINRCCILSATRRGRTPRC
jgi:SRSO17 transposase